MYCITLRTEDDFKIHGTKCKCWLALKMLENAFLVLTRHVNISCRRQVVWPTKGKGGLKHHNFLIFDGKQHPKNI